MIKSKTKRLGINLKSVAYIRDVLLIKKMSFWVCLKTRRVTKRDALVLATLQYLEKVSIKQLSIFQML